MSTTMMNLRPILATSLRRQPPPIAIFPMMDQRRFLSTREDRQGIRERERAEKKARRDARAKKDAELAAYCAKLYERTPEQIQQALDKEFQQEQDRLQLQQLEQEWTKERAAILEEAQAMTRVLFRICLKSVKFMRYGNPHDEIEFRRLEAEQVVRWKQSLQDSMEGIGSMAPPVDRKNELESRYMYYVSHVRERFYGELYTLNHDPWMEDCAEKFIHLLRSGEEARQWVLADYKFEDPFPHRFEEERLNKLEERMTNFVKEVYRGYGWQILSEAQYGNVGDVDEFGTAVEAPPEGKPLSELREGAKHMMRLEQTRLAASLKKK